MKPPVPAVRRLILVDDEPLAREGLATMVSRLVTDGSFPAIDTVAQCANGFEGIEAIRALRPDILLLDISMPEMDGFTMLEHLLPGERPPVIIFVTAFQEHAVKAFDVQAHDYVVKPVSESRLRAALDRAFARLEAIEMLSRHLKNEPPAGGYLQQLTIRELGNQTIVPVSDIDWIEGSRSYVRVRTGKTSRLLRERIHHLEATLDPAMFYRTHRSAIVRLTAIRQILTDSRFKATVVLHSGARVPLSRDRKGGLAARLAARVPSG